MTANGVAYTPSPAVSIPNPLPDNTSPCQFTISGLAAGSSFAINVSSVNQAGVRSVTSSTFQWLVIASAPTVTVLTQPDAASGSRTPTLRFGVAWPNVTVAAGAAANVTFNVLLSGDVDIGVYHSPPVCGVGGVSGAQALGPRQRDCVSAVCDESGCSYTLSLTTPKVYSLQVEALLGGRYRALLDLHPSSTALVLLRC